MAEYIEREAAVEALDVAERFLRSIPAADIAPVVHGKWVAGGIFSDLAKCSVCGAKHFTMGFVHENKFSYCPNCGAKMDGERKSDE